MAISTQSAAPYTAGAALLTVVRRFRDKGLTTPFTWEVLVRAGVPESLVNRTMQAMVVLDLVDDKGMPTETLTKIRLAPEKEYKAVVADWVRSAYAEVFAFVDPSTDDVSAVRDAFRAYTPHGQQERMVALFLALCAEGGLVDESRKSEPKPAARKPQAPRAVITGGGNLRAGAAAIRGSGIVASGNLPPALAGLMQSLPPPDTGWTKGERDKFLTTFASVLDFVIPVVAKVATPQDQGGAT